MAYSRTYREIVQSFERFSFIPAGIRRALTAPVLAGMFFSSCVLFAIQINVLYAGHKGAALPQWVTIAAVLGTLAAIAFALALALALAWIGVKRFGATRQVEDIAYSLGFAFWSCVGVFFLYFAIMHGGKTLP